MKTKIIILTLISTLLLSACAEKEKSNDSESKEYESTTESIADSSVEETSSENDVESTSAISDPSEEENSNTSDNSNIENDTTENSEVKTLWSRYLSAFEIISTDTKYSRILEFGNKTGTATQYAQVTQSSETEFEQMSAYHKFLWTVTYVAPAYYSSTMSNVNYSTWCNSPISASKRYIASNGATAEMIAVHDELLEWSFNYYKANGKVFNFIEAFGIE